SIRWLKAAQLGHPGDLWINYELAESLSQTKPPRRAEALQYYRVVRALRAEMGYLLALTLREQKEIAEALALFQEVIRLQPANPWHHLGLGLTLEDKGDLDGAIKEFKEALRLQKHFPLAHQGLGAALAQKGDMAGAIKEFKEAVRLEKHSPEAHHNLG